MKVDSPSLKNTKIYKDKSVKTFPAKVASTEAAPSILCPLYVCRVSAGFPSPADDYMEQTISLDAQFIRHPTATFFVKAGGDSMIKAGIHEGDTLIVDRSLTAKAGQVVIAVVDGHLTVKRLEYEGGNVMLCPDNDAYKPLKIDKDSDLILWGVVTYVIHAL